MLQSETHDMPGGLNQAFGKLPNHMKYMD